jgi:CheY-like chemotaxis protein
MVAARRQTEQNCAELKADDAGEACKNDYRCKEKAMRTARKVLVVDDDPVIGKSFDRVLSSKGYAVITAGDGIEALSKLATDSYDLVFADIRMPGMSGLDVAERLKASQPWLPVVIVTGYASEANEASAKAMGARGFLRKPLSPEMIEGSAEEALVERATAGKPEAAMAPTSAPESKISGLLSIGLAAKNVGLFFAAPFIGLAYILVFPFVGLAMLAWIGSRALLRHRGAK